MFITMVYFERLKTPLKIPIKAKGICPRIKISKSVLNFGECPVNDYKDVIFRIEN